MTSLPLGNKEEPQTHDRRGHLCFFGGFGGVPPRGLGPQAGEFEMRPALPSRPDLPVLPCPPPHPCPGSALPPCPALPRTACLRTSSSLERGREGQVVCWKLLLLSSGRHRPRGRTTRHPSISAVLGCAMWLFMCRTATGSREQESRKPPLGGGGFGG